MNATVEVFEFPDRKENGYYPVRGMDGQPVAHIQVPWTGRRFTVTAPDGSVMCTGRMRTFARTCDVSDPHGNPMMSVRPGAWTTRTRTVSFSNGVEYSLQKESWPGRNWVVLDAFGAVALNIDDTAGVLSFHPDTYTVRVGSEALSLPLIIAIVQANRVIVKAERQANAS